MAKGKASALTCGGATMFNVLDTRGVKPTQRVGVVGIGGPGHLAIQFAAKWGCKVVASSAFADKRDEAMKFGAKEFYTAKGVEIFEDIAPIDHLLITTTQQMPWPLYL